MTKNALYNASLKLLVKLQVLLLIGFILDLVFFGSGMAFLIFGLAPRKLIYGTFIIISILVFVCMRWQTKLDDLAHAFFFILLFFVWAIVIPLAYNNNVSDAVSDALPLFGVIAYFFSKNIIATPAVWPKVRRVLYLSLVFLAFIHITISMVGIYSKEMAMDIASFLKIFMEPTEYDVESSVMVVPQEDIGVRTYLGASSLLLLGLYFSYAAYKSKKTFASLLQPCVFILAIFATLTRSFLLATLIFFMMVPVSKLLFIKIRATLGNTTLLMAVPFIFSVFLTFLIAPSILDFFGLTRDGSDEIRADQFQPLLNAFLSSPLWGNGFGMSVEPIRNELAPYSYELSVLAIFAKLGILGWILACILAASTILAEHCKGELTFSSDASILYAIYFAYITACFFNPYIFSFFGTLFLLVILFEYSFVSYNSASTIENTTTSVANQRNVHVEHLLIDGTSADDTVAIIKRHESVSMRE